MGKKENSYWVLTMIPEKRDLLEDLSQRILLNWILRKWDMGGGDLAWTYPDRRRAPGNTVMKLRVL